MLHLRIAAIGRDRGGPFADLTGDYLNRAADTGRAIGFAGPDLLASDAPRGLQGAERQRREAQLLADAALPGGEAIILDERGKDLPSVSFANMLAERRDAGIPSLTFFIGGADGHPKDFAEMLSPRPIRRVSFGCATWPHQLARVMAAEQLYRAMTILAGHPYHRV